MKDINHTFEAPHRAAHVCNEFKVRNEEMIRYWVRKAVTDPLPGSIRHHHFAYRSSVFQVEGAASEYQALSYSAFCRRVAAAGGLRSALHRARSKADFRLNRNAVQATPVSEALWVRPLPAPHSEQWNDPRDPATPVTVAIAVDALTGTVHVDSQFIGALPSDEVVVSAVQHYERQHGRMPNQVYVDGADFHHAPRLRRLCWRLGIELRIVSSRRPRHASWPLLVPRHQTVNKVGISAISPTDLVKETRDPIDESITRTSLPPPWRRSLWDPSLRRTTGGKARRLRGESPRNEGEEGVDSGVEQ